MQDIKFETLNALNKNRNRHLITSLCWTKEGRGDEGDEGGSLVAMGEEAYSVAMAQKMKRKRRERTAPLKR